MTRALLLSCLLACFVCTDSLGQIMQTRSVEWSAFDAAMSRSEASGKKVLVDIYAPWCGWCTRLQNEVYTDQDVLDYLDVHFEITRLNIDAATDTVNFRGHDIVMPELAYHLGAQGTPTTVFLKPDGEYITRLPGFLDAGGFLEVLEYIGSDAFVDQSFAEFQTARE